MKLPDVLTLVAIVVVYLTLYVLLSRAAQHALTRLGRRSLGVARLVRPVYLLLFAGLLHGGLVLRGHGSKLTLAGLVAALVFLGVRLLELVFFDLYLRRITGVLVPAVARSIAGSTLVVVGLLGFAHLVLDVPLTQVFIAAIVGLGVFVLLFQDTFKSLKVGVRISLQDDFRVGDSIRVGGVEGEVTAIGWRNTQLLTRTGSEVVVPNHLLFDAPVETWHEEAPYHQGRIEVEVPVDAAPNRVIQELERCARDLAGVLGEPPPRACFMGSSLEAGRYCVDFWTSGQQQRRVLEDRLSRSLWYRLRRVGLVAPNGPVPRLSVRECIENIPFLAAAESSQLDALAQRARVTRFGQGERLCRQGEPGDSLYVLTEGELEVSVDTPHGRRVVTSIGPGGYVGERSLLKGEPRNADVTTKTDSEVLLITKADLLDLLKSDPRLADAFGGEMERRERESERHASEAAPPPRRGLGARIRSFFGRAGK